MSEIEIKTVSGEFVLSNQEKYERAKQEAGPGASQEEILAHYDNFAGLIKNKEGRTIKNGIFWEAYRKWTSEKPEFIKILDQREKSLDEAENGLIGLNSLNVEHKRSFFGTLMTISAATIAGLFFLFTNTTTSSDCFLFLAKISGLGHALFILASSAWLTLILSQENTVINKKLEFIRESKEEFATKVGSEIVNIDSYEKYRNSKYLQEKNINKSINGDSEMWFVGLCAIFVASSLPLVFMFLLT